MYVCMRALPREFVRVKEGGRQTDRERERGGGGGGGVRVELACMNAKAINHKARKTRCYCLRRLAANAGMNQSETRWLGPKGSNYATVCCSASSSVFLTCVQTRECFGL